MVSTEPVSGNNSPRVDSSTGTRPTAETSRDRDAQTGPPPDRRRRKKPAKKADESKPSRAGGNKGKKVDIRA